MRKLIVALAVVVMCGGNAFAGPFGTNMGDTVDKYQNITVSGKNKDNFISQSVPKPHSDFENYLFTFSPQHGLVKISGITKSIHNDAYGINVKSLFKKLYDQINSKYGIGKKNDFIMNGSVWKEDKYWTMGLYKEERILTAFWNPKDNKDNIESIMLKTIALSSDSSLILLSYEYTNFDKYIEEQKKNEQDSL
ncbi:hypothetical protein [uncultured Bilophila sp.]|uniref:hypothetical protein n=1 Tax=uncultured Bilophila sp. TaxID=529385 RepID=UPI0025F32415|nr:hypothetical protein [uncultured Bilophila sp.]